MLNPPTAIGQNHPTLVGSVLSKKNLLDKIRCYEVIPNLTYFTSPANAKLHHFVYNNEETA